MVIFSLVAELALRARALEVIPVFVRRSANPDQSPCIFLEFPGREKSEIRLCQALKRQRVMGFPQIGLDAGNCVPQTSFRRCRELQETAEGTKGRFQALSFPFPGKSAENHPVVGRQGVDDAASGIEDAQPEESAHFRVFGFHEERFLLQGTREGMQQLSFWGKLLQFLQVEMVEVCFRNGGERLSKLTPKAQVLKSARKVISFSPNVNHQISLNGYRYFFFKIFYMS